MFSIKEIKDITNAFIVNGKEDTKIYKFNISKENCNENSFYIPILWKEDRQQYIIKAVQSGAIGYMINSNYEQKEKIIQESKRLNSKIIILEVEDINEAMYKLAKYKRNQNINIPLIAVTGSIGKTTTTAMIASIIKEEKKVLTDIENNNTKTLLSRLMLDIEDYEIAVLEAGMGNKGSMELISKLLNPSIVVINNIGTAHIEKLGNKENILEEKLKLLNYMKDGKTVFLNDDDSLLKRTKLDATYNIKKYSLKEAKNIKQVENFIYFETNLYGKNTMFSLKAYGEHNVLNAICAIRIAEFLNIKKENIEKGIKNYTGVDGRFNVITKNNYTIIDDTYNASIDSMQSGLTTANNMKSYKRKIAILGEMLELGEYSVELHKQVGEIFKEIDFDIVLTQGENTQYICENAKKYMKNKTVINFKTQEELIYFVLKEMKMGDLIYLKASNKMNFNNIVKKLIENI